MRVLSIPVAIVACLLTGPAQAQYRNFESSPNGSGGVHGTYGNENFNMDNSSSGQIGGRRPGVRSVRPSQTPGNVGATQKRCYAGENGNTFCE